MQVLITVPPGQLGRTGEPSSGHQYHQNLGSDPG
jgi:hypothetical protein